MAPHSSDQYGNSLAESQVTMESLKPTWYHELLALGALSLLTTLRESSLQTAARYLIALLVARHVIRAVYCLFIYPHFFSPLRHLPGPKVGTMAQPVISSITLFLIHLPGPPLPRRRLHKPGQVRKPHRAVPLVDATMARRAVDQIHRLRQRGLPHYQRPGGL